MPSIPLTSLSTDLKTTIRRIRDGWAQLDELEWIPDWTRYGLPAPPYNGFYLRLKRYRGLGTWEREVIVEFIDGVDPDTVTRRPDVALLNEVYVGPTPPDGECVRVDGMGLW